MLFPPPLGPTIDDRLAGTDLQVEPAQHVEIAARVRERDAFEPDRDERGIGRSRPARARRRGIGELEEALGHGRSVRARVELRGQVAERQVELGHQYEHGERRLEADPALGEAYAHDHGDERDPERRGQLQDRAGEERDAQRSHRRPAVLVAHLLDPRRLRMRAVERAERRQPANDVEEVVREHRERLPPLACAPLRVTADEPHEDGDERQREEHHARSERIDGRDEDQDGDRYDRGQDELREVARERRLECVDAGDSRGGDLRAARSVECGRLPSQPRLYDVEAQLRDHVAGSAPPRHLERPTPRASERLRPRPGERVAS